PSTPKAPTASLPLLPLRLLPGGANSPGRELHPLKSSASSRRTLSPLIVCVAALMNERRNAVQAIHLLLSWLNRTRDIRSASPKPASTPCTPHQFAHFL